MFESNDSNKPYKEDIPLLEKLGLEIFNCEHGVETSIGTVEDEQYKIDCFVSCVPAQFFKFIITAKDDNEIFEMKTGSGTFTKYWSMAESIGRDLIVIKKIK